MNRREFFAGTAALAAGAQMATGPMRPPPAGKGAATNAKLPARKAATKVAVMAELLFSSEDSRQAAEALNSLAAATRSEPGCIRYAVAQDLDEPGRFHLSELWEDVGALALHFETPHMAVFSAEARLLGYSAPFIKRIDIAEIADFKPSDLRSSRRD